MGEKSKSDHSTAHITALQPTPKKTTLEEIASVGLQTGRAVTVPVLCWAAFGIFAQQNYKLYHTNGREQNPMPELRGVGPWMNLVTDPQGRLAWGAQDLTLMLKPVEQTQTGCWVPAKDPAQHSAALGKKPNTGKGCSPPRRTFPPCLSCYSLL